jgi:hypothetical protein
MTTVRIDDFSVGGAELFCVRLALVGMRCHLERGKGFSQLFALGKGCSPIEVVALAVEADGFADQQGVGDQGDGHFPKRLQGTVRAGDGDCEDGLGHTFPLAWIHYTDYRRSTCRCVDKE